MKRTTYITLILAFIGFIYMLIVMINPNLSKKVPFNNTLVQLKSDSLNAIKIEGQSKQVGTSMIIKLVVKTVEAGKPLECSYPKELFRMIQNKNAITFIPIYNDKMKVEDNATIVVTANKTISNFKVESNFSYIEKHIQGLNIGNCIIWDMTSQEETYLENCKIDSLNCATNGDLNINRTNVEFCKMNANYCTLKSLDKSYIKNLSLVGGTEKGYNTIMVDSKNIGHVLISPDKDKQINVATPNKAELVFKK
jgi:hypothetical protein